MNEKYVIYFNTNRDSSEIIGNAYGYYNGSFYTVNGEYFPNCSSNVTYKTKYYNSEKVANNSAEKLYFKFGYVVSYKIEKVEQIY